MKTLEEAIGSLPYFLHTTHSIVIDAGYYHVLPYIHENAIATIEAGPGPHKVNMCLAKITTKK